MVIMPWDSAIELIKLWGGENLDRLGYRWL